MENPFDELSERLERIEDLLTDRHEMRVEPSEDEEDKLLNVKEAAAFLGDAVATLSGRISKNEIPFYKRDKKLYIKQMGISPEKAIDIARTIYQINLRIDKLGYFEKVLLTNKNHRWLNENFNLIS